LWKILDPFALLDLDPSVRLPFASADDSRDIESKITRRFFITAALESPEKAKQWMTQNDLENYQERFEKTLQFARFLTEPGAYLDDFRTFFGDDTPVFSPKRLAQLAASLSSIEDSANRESAVTALIVS
jgi:hypothetical protein